MNPDYLQILETLFQMNPSQTVASNLENARKFHLHLGNPAHFYPTIHIAGSNGKGSVATKIAKVLELSGYRVGLYTSPHLSCFRERIAINGQLISESAVVEGFRKLEEIKGCFEIATFFELSTFLALNYFYEQNVDVAVIETGIGGRFDATNVVMPCLSVITSISYEHCSILGNTLEKIAREKAGIIKPNVPVVIGPHAEFEAIYSEAKRLDSPLYLSEKVSPFFDEENSAIAELSLEQLTPQFEIPSAALKAGLNIRPECRFERQGEVVFDVAHNPDAISHLIQALHKFYPNREFRFLLGFSKDKEIDVCLKLIADVAAHIHFVQAPCRRAVTVEGLEQSLKRCTPIPFTSHVSVEEGVHAASFAAIEEKQLLIICGSFYIMQKAKEARDLFCCRAE